MVHFCKVCDVHMFFVEEIIMAMSSIAKTWPKYKDSVDILIKCLVNSLCKCKEWSEASGSTCSNI